MRFQEFFVLALVCGAFLAGVAVKQVFWGPAEAQSGKTISAQRIMLVDSRGKVRMDLGVWPPDSEGSAYLALNDRQGSRRIDINVSEDGTPFASFWDRSASAYGVTPAKASITFYGSNGQPSAEFPGAVTSASSDGTRHVFTSPGVSMDRTMQNQIDLMAERLDELERRLSSIER